MLSSRSEKREIKEKRENPIIPAPSGTPRADGTAVAIGTGIAIGGIGTGIGTETVTGIAIEIETGTIGTDGTSEAL